MIVIRYTGPPVPHKWEPEGGYVWTHRDECAKRSMTPPGTGFCATYAEGRFLAFSTIFPHPADRPPKTSAEDKHVYKRFTADERRQPLYTYVRGNMVVKPDGSGHRHLSAREREALMGYPPDYTAALQPARGSSLDAEHARRHALGNTFHVPSIIMLLSLLVCPAGARATVTKNTCIAEGPIGTPGDRLSVKDDTRERHWPSTLAKGTVWDSAWEPPPGVPWLGQHIMEAALLLLPSDRLRGAAELVQRALKELHGVKFDRLLDYREYCRRDGAPASATGPDVQALWDKSPMHAAVQHQHRASHAGSSAPNMIDWGVKPLEHERQARLLQHPFAADAPLEMDLRFAVDAYIALGPRINRARVARMRLLQKVAKALEGLDSFLLLQRHISLPGAPGVRPAYTAFIVILLEWPDKGLPTRLALGFELADDIETSNVLRPILPKKVGKGPEPGVDEHLMGAGAVTYVDDLERNKVLPEHAQTIWDLTAQEVEAGIARPLVRREEMDQCFPDGSWRPLVRHVIWQQTQFRPIDDGKRSRTNALTVVNETVVCIPPEFILLLLRKLVMSCVEKLGAVPAWFQPVVSIQDWWKGYRQLFPVVEHLGLCVVAIKHPETRDTGTVSCAACPSG